MQAPSSNINSRRAIAIYMMLVAIRRWHFESSWASKLALHIISCGHYCAVDYFWILNNRPAAPPQVQERSSTCTNFSAALAGCVAALCGVGPILGHHPRRTRCRVPSSTSVSSRDRAPWPCSCARCIRGKIQVSPRSQVNQFLPSHPLDEESQHWNCGGGG